MCSDLIGLVDPCCRSSPWKIHTQRLPAEVCAPERQCQLGLDHKTQQANEDAQILVELFEATLFRSTMAREADLGWIGAKFAGTQDWPDVDRERSFFTGPRNFCAPARE